MNVGNRQKAPAFQWYPKDFETDEQAALMTLAERGAYITLLGYCWLEGSIPDDPGKLARLCRCSPREMRSVWPAVAVKFEPHEDGRLTNPRIEKERSEQRAYREAQSESGRLGAKTRWASHGEPNGVAINSPMAKNSSASASASASANTPQTPLRATTGTDNWELFRTAYESLPKATNEQDWVKAVHEWISHDDAYEAQTEAILEYMRWEARNGWRDSIAARDGRFIPLPVKLLRSRAWTRKGPPEPAMEPAEEPPVDWESYSTDDLQLLLGRADCLPADRDRINAILQNRENA